MIKKEYIDDYVSRATKLVEQMTLEEKVYQLRNGAPALERLGIKAYNYWNEALHGVARAGTATVFPQAIGMAASFDEDLIEKVADTISTEGRAKYNMQSRFGDAGIYKGLNFWAPNINIFRDPRWGRGHETYGEDPYLTSRLGIRFVKGIQGDNDKYLKAAACAKHFAVHSGPESLRHGFNAVVSEQDLRETYLPAFEALVKEAGVEAVMGAYNRTNGEPCCGSKRLLKDILRKEWGFKGHVTSDCWAIKDMNECHCVTSSIVESVALAMNNGCDLNCGDVYQYLIRAVNDGLTSESLIDDALVRVLTSRFKLGLFDNAENNPYNAIDYSYIDTDEAKELNTRIARESIVLLKNKDGFLPLDTGKIKTIGVIGPNADSRMALVGNYEGTSSEYITVLEGIRRECEKENIRVLYSAGCHLYKNRMSNLSEPFDRLAEIKAVAELSDVLVACMGLDATLEGEEGDTGNEYGSGDKPNLRLPGIQEPVLEAMAASGKPVVLIILSGSALAVDHVEDKIPAIIQGWYPGARGGLAIADILFGKYSPEGKLPVTFYYGDDELPAFEDYSMKNRTYRYMEGEAMYPFGYGLSYSSFSEKITNLSGNTIDKDNKISFDVEVKNTGAMRGGVTVQTYIAYEGIENAPKRQLKKLKKLHLDAGEVQKVTLTLEASDFALFDKEGKKKVNAGRYTVFVGDSQPDSRSEKLTGTKCCSFTVDAVQTYCL